MWSMVALSGVLLLVVVALTYRLWKLRQVGGTAAILRDVPAVGGHGWRHGVVRYRGRARWHEPDPGADGCCGQAGLAAMIQCC